LEDEDRDVRGLSHAMAPFFQEYDFAALDVERDATIIIDRTLEHGDPTDVRWLLGHYGADRIRRHVQERGARHLSPRAFAFWRLVLDIHLGKAHPWPDMACALWGRGSKR